MRTIGGSGCDKDFSVATELGHGRRPCRIGLGLRRKGRVRCRGVWVAIENSLSRQSLAWGGGFMTR